jgi:hypothetical protein
MAPPRSIAVTDRRRTRGYAGQSPVDTSWVGQMVHLPPPSHPGAAVEAQRLRGAVGKRVQWCFQLSTRLMFGLILEQARRGRFRQMSCSLSRPVSGCTRHVMRTLVRLGVLCVLGSCLGCRAEIAVARQYLIDRGIDDTKYRFHTIRHADGTRVVVCIRNPPVLDTELSLRIRNGAVVEVWNGIRFPVPPEFRHGTRPTESERSPGGCNEEE